MTKDTVRILASKNALKYGYFSWPKSADSIMQDLLGSSERVDVVLGDIHVGARRVDRKYRRISLGVSRTRNLAGEVRRFAVQRGPKGELVINLE